MCWGVCFHIIDLAFLFNFSVLHPPPIYSPLERGLLEDKNYLTRKGNMTQALKAAVKNPNL